MDFVDRVDLGTCGYELSEWCPLLPRRHASNRYLANNVSTLASSAGTTW